MFKPPLVIVTSTCARVNQVLSAESSQ